MFGQSKELKKLNLKLMLSDLKIAVLEKILEKQDEQILDLKSTINLQRATIEGLKSGKYVTSERRYYDYN